MLGVFLRQHFSRNLERGWWPVSPDNFISASPPVLGLWACVWSHLAFYVDAGNLTWFLKFG